MGAPAFLIRPAQGPTRKHVRAPGFAASAERSVARGREVGAAENVFLNFDEKARDENDTLHGIAGQQ